MIRFSRKIGWMFLVAACWPLLSTGLQGISPFGGSFSCLTCAFAQEAPLVNVGDAFRICLRLESWHDCVGALYGQLASKHNAANAATEDCSTDAALATVRSLFLEAGALFEDLLDEVELFGNRYLGRPEQYPETAMVSAASTEAIALALQEAAVLCTEYQTGVQFMIDMTYAHAEENTDLALTLGETGAGYCNEAMTVDDVLVTMYETIDSDVCQRIPAGGLMGRSRVGASEQPNRPVFSWGVNAELLETLADFMYEWVLVESFSGQTAEEALATNPVLYELRDALTYNGFRYPVGAPDLDPGTEYCWRVDAVFEGQSIASGDPQGFRLEEMLADEPASVRLLTPENGESVGVGSPLEWRMIAPDDAPPDLSYRVLIWELPEILPGLEPFLPIAFELPTGDPVPSATASYLKEGYVDRAIELERQYSDAYERLRVEYDEDLRRLEAEWASDAAEWGEEDAWIMFLSNIADLNREYSGRLRTLAASFFRDFEHLEDEFLPAHKEYFSRRFFGVPDDLLYVPPPPGYEHLEEEEIPYVSPGTPPPRIWPLVNQLSDLLNDVWSPLYESLWTHRYEEHPITEADILGRAPVAILEVSAEGSVAMPLDMSNTTYAWQVQALRQSRLGTCEVLGVSDMRSVTVSETEADDDEECEVRTVQVRRSNVFSEPDELTGDLLETIVYEGKVEVLACDPEETWWKVRTPNGTVGWMLQSHLVPDKRPIIQGVVREGKAEADEEIGAGIKG